MKRNTVFLLAVVALLSTQPSPAEESWIALGAPPGGDVRSLAADPRDPSLLYLGTADGHLYRSRDGGGHWQRTAPGFPIRGMSLDEMVVTPQGEILVGYWQIAGSGGGVARSSDGGSTFLLAQAIEGESVRALAIAPARPEIVVAGTISGVFRSDDGGTSWSRISPVAHAELRNFESIAIDPSDPDIIYAGTWHLAWKTVDGGRTWRPIHAGMIADSDVFTLTLDRRTSRTVFATACSGIYRSFDGGGTWARLRGIPSSSRRTRAFAQDPERPELLYAGTTEGLWMSEDNGANWRMVSSRSLIVNAVLVERGGVVLLGSEGLGVLRSTNRGRTFAASNRGFAERFVSRILFDSVGQRVLAGISGDRQFGGVLAAPRVEGPWTRLAPGLEGREVLSFAVGDREVLAGTEEGIFRTSSPSRMWSRLPATVGGAYPRVVDVVAPSDDVLLAATPEGLLRSVDAGETWQVHTLGAARSVSALAVLKGHRCLAVTPLDVFRSTDLGAGWTRIGGNIGETTVRSLVVLPGESDVVFATTARGLYRSADGGVTWTPRGGGLPQSDVTSLGVHPDGRTLYATDYAFGGVYRSDDAGESWQRISTAGLPSDRVFTVFVDPMSPSRVVASSRSGGLHLLSAPQGTRQAAP